MERRRKSDANKVALARRLRQETTVSLKCIAENLHMGTWTHVSNLLYHCAKQKCQYLALTPFFTPMAKVIPSDNHPQ